ncbi:MAG: hypothetical protein WCG10_05510 [Chlamydiota bacterium]
MNSADTKRPCNLLVITTSGGGGHLQAANAKILEEQSKTPPTPIIVHNLLQQAGGKWLGWFMIHYVWNTAQRKGSVKGLELWINMVPLFDVLFWVPVFLQILHKLFKYKIERVIDTQPLCLSAIIQAIRLYSFITKKNLVLEKILTELPTKHAAYYLKPIKRLPKKNRSLIKLQSIPPLLTEHETPEEFWKKNAGLSNENIFYGDLPIRPSFKYYHEKPPTNDPLVLHIQLKTDSEKTILHKIINYNNSPKHPLTATFDNLNFNLTLLPEDVVTTLMLGSQTIQEATLNYVEQFITLMKQVANTSVNYYLFVFCSQTTSPSLQEMIYTLITQTKDYPAHLKIIPMSSQQDGVIAPLYFKSHTTITKSGGITAMELLTVARGKILIHHDNNGSSLEKFLSYSPLSKNHSYTGMPKWEYGNATYLEKHKGAKLITPATLLNTVRPYLV